jgi:DNA-binding CsgD family transcriptional regulator
MADLKLTPTERRIYEHLADGLGHPKKELMKLLNDDMTGENTLGVHLYRLRLKLKAVGEDVICQAVGQRKIMVRRVIQLATTGT